MPRAADGEALGAAYLDREMPCFLLSSCPEFQRGNRISQATCIFSKQREAGPLSLARQSSGEHA